MKNLKLKLVMVCLGTLLTSSLLIAGDKPVLVIPDKLTYHGRVELPNNVVDGCRPEVNMSYQLRGRMRKVKGYSEFMLKPPTDGRNFHTLNMEIVDVFGLGGGAFSGSKRLCVKGELFDKDGKLLGSFYCYRTSVGNMMALGMQGTCDIYMKIYNKMMKDLIKWLKKPGVDTYLGDQEKAKITEGYVLEYERKQKSVE